MGSTLAPAVPASDYPRAPSVSLLVAVKLGVRENTAHQLLYSAANGVATRPEQVAELLTMHGHLGLRERIFGRLRAILNSHPAPRPSREIIQSETIADLNEDIEQARYLGDPTPQNRQRLLDALYAQHERSWELIQSLEAEKAEAAR